MSGNRKINVTRPSLPPLEDVIPYLKSIWERGILTNNGPLHQQLETALAEYLGVPYVSLFNNGTNALITALKVFDLSGEVITTPYSFIATAHAVSWNGLKPVFADIEPDGLNLSPAALERAITPNTCAILPVHCYGIPCNTSAISEIASRYNLKVIYDAAHAFGVRDTEGSILRHGDLSVLSLHATKVFNTFEGGAVISHSAKIKERVDALRNFGFSDELNVVGIGGNGKMSELNAAVGLAQLNHIDEMLSRRSEVARKYSESLKNIKGIKLPTGHAEHHNNSYFPIIVDEKFSLTRDQLYTKLQEHGIYARRYFYPVICDFLPYKHASGAETVQRARIMASHILCLPIYPDIEDNDINSIIQKITEYQLE